MPIRQTAASLALLMEVTAALSAASLTAVSPAMAQAPAAVVADAPVPPGAESPESLVKAIYAVISGPAGQPRDWTRFKALCLPDARLVATHVMPDGATRLRSYGVDQYIEAASKNVAAQGFFETGAVRDLSRFDRTVTIVSPYESRHAPGDKPFARGVNHFQLFNDGRRWWVVDIFWEDESPSAPLPSAMARQLGG